MPGSANQTLGTCIFTYDGMMRIGLKTDAAVIPDPSDVLAAFQRELDELADALTASNDQVGSGHPQATSGWSASRTP